MSSFNVIAFATVEAGEVGMEANVGTFGDAYMLALLAEDRNVYVWAWFVPPFFIKEIFFFRDSANTRPLTFTKPRPRTRDVSVNSTKVQTIGLSLCRSSALRLQHRGVLKDDDPEYGGMK